MRLRQEKVKDIKNKYKLEYIAKQIGVSKQFISYLFHNKKTCKVETAKKIVDIVDPNASIEDYFKEN